MTSASPHLEALLRALPPEGDTLRKDAAFHTDLVHTLTLATHGNRLALGERRRRDLHRLKQAVVDAEARWTERLLRLEEWGKKVDDLLQHATQQHHVVQAGAWLQRARAMQDKFIRGLTVRAEFIKLNQTRLHDKLEAWLAELGERKTNLDELIDRKDLLDKPLYVSRARKQPEVEFIQEQLAMSDILGGEVALLRRSLQQARGRLAKALQAIDQQTAGAELLYEVYKQEILIALESTEGLLKECRERVLSEALIYESGRHLLRQLQNKTFGLRCLEDIPQAPTPAWKKLFPPATD